MGTKEVKIEGAQDSGILGFCGESSFEVGPCEKVTHAMQALPRGTVVPEYVKDAKL